jgi:hypothetical protein
VVFRQNPKQLRATTEKVVGYMTLGIGTAALPHHLSPWLFI